MSTQIFDEVDYNVYLLEHLWSKIDSNPIKLTEAPNEYDFDSYPKLTVKEALEILDTIYNQNSYILYKEPWYNLLFTRLKRDIKRGFVSMIDIQPSMSQTIIRILSPMLKLFSGIEIFSKILDANTMFYETYVGGCYNSVTNKMMIVVSYIDRSNINLDMLKTILHEYCHFYARKKHALYVSFFEKMVSKFYRTLIEEISYNFKLKLNPVAIQNIHSSIMKWNFYKLDNIKAKKHNFERCIEEINEISEDFARVYLNMLVSKALYKKDDFYKSSIELFRRAYLSISDEVTASHISNKIYSYQEFYCADEIIAVMSFYKPNYKPYLQMLESLV